MSTHKNLFLFFIISALLHFALIYYTKPNLLLLSSLQNIKLKKKEIIKVKLLKIKIKQKPKKVVKPKPKAKPKPKLKPKPKSKSKPKSKLKSKSNHKIKTKIKRKATSKIKKKSKVRPHKVRKKKIKTKPKKKKNSISLTAIHKKVAELKKKEEEKKIKEELKKEAAIFYANRLVSLVQRLWIFPKSIQDSELPFLKIKVKLRVRKDGTIIGEPVIISQSKNKIFNESALRAIKKLYKYKIPLPDIIDDKYIDIILTLTPPER